MDLSAQDVIDLLELSPLEPEGGFFRETYRDPLTLVADALGGGLYGSGRSLSTSIYYLLTPESHSKMHMLPGAEIYHFYRGDPVDMLQLHPDGTSGIITLGSDIAAGMQMQVIIPGGVWQGSRLKPGGKWALMGATMAPGFDYEDYHSADQETLLGKYPDRKDRIAELL